MEAHVAAARRGAQVLVGGRFRNAEPVDLSSVDVQHLGELEAPAEKDHSALCDVLTGLARGSGLGNSHRSSAGARAAGPVRQEADPGLSQGAGVCLRPSQAVRTIPVAR